jgi:alkaline phosphatase D
MGVGMTIKRRQFLEMALAGAVVGAATPAFATGGFGHPAHEHWTPRPTDPHPGKVFRHGVASGDPLQNRVILWTRVTPRHHGDGVVRVECNVAIDPNMRRVVSRYATITSSERDFTVKFDAHGLHPGETYYYQFVALGEASPIGRTRTLPVHTDRVRFALASCSNWATGFFAAYGHIARRQDLDAVLHVGDYIYEYANGGFGDGTGIGRIPAPDKEIVTLNDYRTRHAQYRTDPQLQAAHRQHPWIVVWDDHEIANDAWVDGAQNHNPELSEGDWRVRKQKATRAWYEWLPVREPESFWSAPGRIYRSFRFGDLVTLDMLDTRHAGREQQIPGLVDLNTLGLVPLEGTPEEVFAEISRRIAAYNAPARQLLGSEQELWLAKRLLEPASRKAKWQVLGQQVMMGQLTVANPALPPGVRLPINPDQWDGYAGARERLLQFIAANGIKNVIVLTGDIHSSWANDIARNPYAAGYNPATDSLAVELVCPGISSPFFTDNNPQVAKGFECLARATNPHTRFVDFEKNGYVVLDIDRYRARGEWYHLDNVLDPDSAEVLAAAIQVDAGQNFITQVEDGTGVPVPQCVQPVTAAPASPELLSIQ